MGGCGGIWNSSKTPIKLLCVRMCLIFPQILKGYYFRWTNLLGKNE